MSDADLTPVSVEQDGRILTGVGTTVEALEATMERHAPEAAEPVEHATPVAEAGATAAPEPVSSTDRNADGTFKKVTRGAKRFDQLTGEREAARREADDAKRERDELKARLQALEQTQTRQPAAQPAAAAKPETPAATRAKPTVDQVGSTYPQYEDFLEDLADWKAEQRLAAIDLDAVVRRRLEADTASRSLQDHLALSQTRAKQVYPDFEAVVSAPHMQANNWPLEKIRAIASLPEPEHIQHALGKDPALAERLRTLADPVQFGMELAKLIPTRPVASTASTGRAGSVIAPAPYQPVGSGSKTTGTPSADLAKRGFDFDQSGYRERRAAERGIRRQ